MVRVKPSPVLSKSWQGFLASSVAFSAAAAAPVATDLLLISRIGFL